MLNFILKFSFYSLFLGVVSTTTYSQAGNRNGKMEQEEEKIIERSYVPYPQPFNALPEDINKILFSSFDTDLDGFSQIKQNIEQVRQYRLISKEWDAFMSEKIRDVSANISSLSKEWHTLFSTNYSILTYNQSSDFRYVLHSFPEHYPSLFQIYTALDPFRDAKRIKFASDVLKSPNLQAFFEKKLEPIELDLLTKCGVNKENEEAFFINIGQKPHLYPQLQQYFMGIFLLAKNGHKDAEDKRHSFSVLIQKALDVFNKGLMDEGNAVVINKNMKKILKKHAHLVAPPFWVAYLASSYRGPQQQATILMALQDSDLKKKLDRQSISSFFVYFYDSFPQWGEHFFNTLPREKVLTSEKTSPEVKISKSKRKKKEKKDKH